MNTTNSTNSAGGYSYTPALAPLLVIGAIAFGVWSWITRWSGVTLTVLGEPATISSGYLSLAGVLIAACLLFRAPLRSTLAVTALMAGFAFLWLLAQVVPAVVA